MEKIFSCVCDFFLLLLLLTFLLGFFLVLFLYHKTIRNESASYSLVHVAYIWYIFVWSIYRNLVSITYVNTKVNGIYWFYYRFTIKFMFFALLALMVYYMICSWWKRWLGEVNAREKIEDKMIFSYRKRFSFPSTPFISCGV